MTLNVHRINQRKLFSKVLDTCALLNPTGGVTLIIAGIHCQTGLWIWGGAIDPQFGQSFRVQPEVVRCLALKPYESIGKNGVQHLLLGTFCAINKHCRGPTAQPQPPLLRVLVRISLH